MFTHKHSILRILYPLLLVLFFYSVFRIVFLAVHADSFDADSFANKIGLLVKGIRFDLSALFVCNSLFILLSLLPLKIVKTKAYQVALKWIFIVFNSFFLLLNAIDIAYFPFIKKRMQFDAFMFVTGKKGDDFYKLLPTFLARYWYLWISWVVIVFLLVKNYNRATKFNEQIQFSKKHFLLRIGILVFSLGVCLVGIRGGLQLRPISIINASEMTSAKNIPVLLNTPFSIYNTVKKQTLQLKNYFAENDIDTCFNPIHSYSTDSAFVKKNVVILIVESLSKDFIGRKNGVSRTPFLDSLFAESYVFENAFANAKESIQGIPAVVSSIPSWQNDPFIFSTYSGNAITSLPNLLAKKGYTSTFFHGGTSGTMGFSSYCALAQFNNYVGREEYNNDNDYDGHWGIWDEPFLQFAANKMNTTKQPFANVIFTLSSHHPFSLPKQYENVIKKDELQVLPTIEYTDLAIRNFFETAKEMPWFKNTLFVITADHTAYETQAKTKKAFSDYRIPIVFYDAANAFKGRDYKVANQIDILPSVLHLLRYNEPFFAFGNNLFVNRSCSSFSVNFNAGIYQLIDSANCYQFNGEKGIGFYKWVQDSLLQNNLISDIKFNEDIKSNDYRLKRKIQEFNNRMINNAVTIK